jgi:hypothetical protein
MSFIERKIDIRMVLDGDTFDGSNNTVLLQGLRCQASILSYQGGQTPAGSQLQMRIYGMHGEDMAKLSTLGFSAGTYVKNSIEVSAGDDASGMSEVFSGNIASCRVDYNAMPDVGVDILAFDGYTQQFAPVAGISYRGAMDVATMLKAITDGAGLKFTNNGVTTKLSNHAVGGTAITQIRDICFAAGIGWSLQGGTLSIWPKLGNKDDMIIAIDANTGLVGYPMYSAQGVDVVSLFNPAIQVGRRMKVTSSIPNLNPQATLRFVGHAPNMEKPSGDGTYHIFTVTHDLSSQTPGGPWFTRCKLATLKNVARSSAA